MLIDVICLLLLVWAIFKGLKNGFIVAIFSFFAFIIGLAAALKLFTIVAGYLGASTNISQRLLPFLAFALVFIVVVLLVRLGAKAIEGALHLAMLGWANRLGGVLFYALIYFFIFSLLLFYANQIKVFKPETVNNSIAYPFIEPLGPMMIKGLGIFIPWFAGMFQELESFFAGVATKAED